MKYYILGSSVFTIADDNKCVKIDSIWPSFGDVYRIEEDGEFNGKEVNKGDFVVTFYRSNDDDYAIVRAGEDLHTRFTEKFKEQKKEPMGCAIGDDCVDLTSAA